VVVARVGCRRRSLGNVIPPDAENGLGPSSWVLLPEGGIGWSPDWATESRVVALQACPNLEVLQAHIDLMSVFVILCLLQARRNLVLAGTC
jgi:hypothetical protein